MGAAGSGDASALELQLHECNADPLLLHSQWVITKLHCIPVHYDELLSVQFRDTTMQSRAAVYRNLCSYIMEYSRRVPGFSIVDLVEHLVQINLLLAPNEQSNTSQPSKSMTPEFQLPVVEVSTRELAVSLVFTLIGWQTMLYIPLLDCRPSSQLYIDKAAEGFSSQSYLSLVQDQNNAEYNLPDFLSGFFRLFPTGADHAGFRDREDHSPNSEDEEISPRTMNASLLYTIGKIKIKWIDVLPPHLEFDRKTKTLLLFRHPSFCRMILLGNSGTDQRQLLQSCVQESMQNEIDKLMIEITQSYRLLFGEDKKARCLYKSIKPDNDFLDPFLDELCTSPQMSTFLNSRGSESRQQPGDFSLYKKRLLVLKEYLDRHKPRTCLDIWRDNRDSVQWLTFWALMLFGGVGVILEAAQIALQAAQLRQGATN